MPQIMLECTGNIIEKDLLSQLLLQIHPILSEKLPTDISSCKSRAIIHDIYSVGNGDVNNAFVHLSIGVLKGRSTELLDQIADILMTKLKDFFHLSLAKFSLQITIGISNVPDVYHKFKKS
jgi:5-carboxymethyl-2-hydroxymuconate isomerase